MFIFISLAYSSAITCIYMLALTFFHVTYKYEEIFLIKYYSRTKVFSEELPELSMKLIKYAVFVNLISSAHTLFTGRIYHLAPLPKNHFNNIFLETEWTNRILNSVDGIIFLFLIAFVLIFYLLAPYKRYILNFFCKTRISPLESGIY